MPSLYVDLAALRRLLWASATLSVSLTAWPSSAACETNVATFASPFVFWLISFEAVQAALHASGVLRATYISLSPCAPFISVPPVKRVSIGSHGAAAACGSSLFIVVAAALSCSPWPLLIAAGAVALHAVVLLFPCFGSVRFWRLHYIARVGSGYEEWFCTAELAARVVMTVESSEESHVCVVGSGLSALPEVLSARCRRVSAVDASPAAAAAMSGRDSAVEWHVGDVTDMRRVMPTASVDIVCDKGTFAALLEHSSSACGAGFAEARRVLRPGGHIVTIALVPLAARRLAATGFELVATYRLPAVHACGCDPSRRLVYAQVARALESTAGAVDGDGDADGDGTFRFDGAGYEEFASAVELPLLAAGEP